MDIEHEALIRAAIRLAGQAVQHGNHPFGALLVKDSEVLMQAENSVLADDNSTHHAELNLVRRATQRFDAATLAQCTLYTSTEPCAMCAGAIYIAGITRVVYGCSGATLAALSGWPYSIPCRAVFAQGTQPVTVVGPMLESEAASVHATFWTIERDN